MLIDSHCHLDRIDPTPFGGRVEDIVTAANANGVEHILCVSIDLETWSEMEQKVASLANVSLSVGVHPSAEGRSPDEEELVEYSAHPKVVAIGETGLDYYYGNDRRELQQARFRTHIRVARQVGKPLIVHTRDAKADTLQLLETEGAAEVGGVLHCFTEDLEMAERALELGFYISFSGILTFRNAVSLREVARRLPLDRILIETDAPYLAPVPHRGKPNQPAWVSHVADCLAKIRDLPGSDIAQASSDNYRRLFGTGSF